MSDTGSHLPRYRSVSTAHAEYAVNVFRADTPEVVRASIRAAYKQGIFDALMIVTNKMSNGADPRDAFLQVVAEVGDL